MGFEVLQTIYLTNFLFLEFCRCIPRYSQDKSRYHRPMVWYGRKWMLWTAICFTRHVQKFGKQSPSQIFEQSQRGRWSDMVQKVIRVLRTDSYPKTKVQWFYLKYRTQLNIIFSITMCPNTKAFFGTTTPKDCAACNAFMTDLSLIAQYDPSHFKVIYSYVTPVRFDLGFWNFLKFYLSKSLVPSALKSVPN